MEFISSKLNFGQYNIRTYWNTNQQTVVLCITDQEDGKRIVRANYKPLVYVTTKPNDIKNEIERHVRGLLNAEFDLDIGQDNAKQIVNDLFKKSRNKKTAEKELDEPANHNFKINEIYGSVRKDGLMAWKNKADNQERLEKQIIKSHTPKHVILDYLDEYHPKDINNINLGIDNDLIIDYKQFEQHTSTLADILIDDPNMLFEYIDKAMEFLIITKDNAQVPYNVRFKNIDTTPLNKMLSHNYGKFMETEAIVKGIYEPQQYTRMEKYRCKKCKEEIILFDNRLLGKKDRLPADKCPICEYKPEKDVWYETEPTAEIKEDEIYLLLEEPADEVGTADKPRRILARVDGKISQQAKYGERVRITGILSGYGAGINHMGESERFIFNINYLERIEDHKVEITKEDEQQIIEYSKKDNILDILINSFAPNLILSREIKLAVLCFLVKAGYVDDEDERGREEIHLLIIGDPGTAKTQLLLKAYDLAEKGIKASGTNTSGAGVTGAVDKDPVLNMPIVLPGALALANNGHLFLDECEKMGKEESQKMLDGLEKGEFEVTKFGLNETLKSKTSLMAIGNPLLGKFDPYSSKSINDQLNIYPPLLSRFDLAIALEDKEDEERDSQIAKSILNKFRKQKIPIYDEPKEKMDESLLIKYLAYARRNFKPMPLEDDDMDNFLSEYYLDARQRGKDARSFEAVNRFAGAIAKLQLNEHIQQSDYIEAVTMQDYSIKTLGLDPANVDSNELRGLLDNKAKEHRKQIIDIINWYIYNNDNLDNEAIPKDRLKREFMERYNLKDSTFYKSFKQLKNANEIKEAKGYVYLNH